MVSYFSHVWLCNYVNCSTSGSSVHGILQERILEWVAISSPGDLPNPGTEPVSFLSHALTGGFFTTSSTCGMFKSCENTHWSGCLLPVAFSGMRIPFLWEVTLQLVSHACLGAAVCTCFWCSFRHSTQTEFISVAFEVVLEFDVFLVTTVSQVFCHMKKVILCSVRTIEPKILRDTDMRMEKELWLHSRL